MSIGWSRDLTRQFRDFDSGSVAGTSGWYSLVGTGSVAVLTQVVTRPAPCRGALESVWARLNSGGPRTVTHELTLNGVEVGGVAVEVTSTAWVKFAFDLSETAYVEGDTLALKFSGTQAGDRLLVRSVWLFCMY